MRHLPLFLGLRQRGLTWTIVASLLTARGVRRADGHSIPVEQLRGVVSRQMRRSEISASDRIDPIGLADRSQATRKSLSVAKRKRDASLSWSSVCRHDVACAGTGVLMSPRCTPWD